MSDASVSAGVGRLWRRPSGGHVSVLRRVVSRLLYTIIPVFLISTFLTFSLGAASSSSPAAVQLGDSATPEAVKRLDHSFGLDRPFIVQYGDWIGHVVRGDLGKSWFTGIDVWSSIRNRLPVDLSITLFALVIAIVLGMFGGLLAGTKPRSWADHTVNLTSSLVVAMPEFVIGVFLIVLFAVKWGVLPATGYVSPTDSVSEWFRHAAMPAFALSLFPAANVARQLRTSVVRVFHEHFVLGAVVRGFSRRRIIFHHVLRNAAGPAVTSLGLDVPRLLGGAVIVETVFALPGLGQYAIQSAIVRDVPAVQGVLVVVIMIVLVVNLVVNAILEWLRPEARR